MFDGIRKCLDIPYQIGHIIPKVRKVDLEREGDIDFPPPVQEIILLRFLSRMKLRKDV